MRTSVIVVTCRPHPWLSACLESVLHQGDEVILVDNGSPEGWAGSVGRPLGARVIELRHNTGFTGGVNSGLKAATGDVIALLNDDAMAGDGWLEHSAAVLADPTIAAVSPKLLLAWPQAEIVLPDDPWYAPGDGRPLGRQLRSVTVAGQDVLAAVVGRGVHELETSEAGDGQRWRWTAGRESFYVPLPDNAAPDDVLINGEAVQPVRIVDLINNAGSYLSQEGHGGDYGFEMPDGPAFAEPTDRFAATGAAMVVRAETFRRLGGMASSFFAYYEDTDWSWRAQLAGLRIRYDPSTTVRHVRGVSSGGASDQRVRFLAARNRLHTLARNAPLDLLRWQLHRSREPGRPPGLGIALAARIPRGLAERRMLARQWSRTPPEVFGRWGGVGEGGPTTGVHLPEC